METTSDTCVQQGESDLRRDVGLPPVGTLALQLLNSLGEPDQAYRTAELVHMHYGPLHVVFEAGRVKSSRHAQ